MLILIWCYILSFVEKYTLGAACTLSCSARIKEGQNLGFWPKLTVL